MIRSILFGTAMVVYVMPSFSFAALESTLAPMHKEALKDAYQSKNDFVINAVKAQIKQTVPKKSADVELYITNLVQQEVEKEQQKKLLSAANKTVPKWSGSVDFGASMSTGNTDKRHLNGNTKLSYTNDNFINTLALTARGSSDSDVTTDEEYLVNNKIKYSFSEKNYSFLELEYVNDRFSGFDYRMSELAGYGHKFIESDSFKLSADAGVGLRQSENTEGIKINSLLGKIGVDTLWNITNGLSLENETSSSYASDALITISDTSLKNKLTESLYLKLNYHMQHIDDVPADTKHIDTLTSVNVGYEF